MFAGPIKKAAQQTAAAAATTAVPNLQQGTLGRLGEQVNGSPQVLQLQSLGERLNGTPVNAPLVVQRYDIRAYDSWADHYTELLQKFVQLPANTGLVVSGFNVYLNGADQTANAIYVSPDQEGLTGEGENMLEQHDEGFVILSRNYVDSLGELPADERVATLLSTIRHELQHAENFRSGLTGNDYAGFEDGMNSDLELCLDEVIAHCENILNNQLGGEKVDAPLWNQLDHLQSAEEYLNEYQEQNGPQEGVLYDTAMARLDEARQRLAENLEEAGAPDDIEDRYLEIRDFAQLEFQHGNPNTRNSQAFRDAMNG